MSEVYIGNRVDLPMTDSVDLNLVTWEYFLQPNSVFQFLAAIVLVWISIQLFLGAFIIRPKTLSSRFNIPMSIVVSYKVKLALGMWLLNVFVVWATATGYVGIFLYWISPTLYKFVIGVPTVLSPVIVFIF